MNPEAPEFKSKPADCSPQSQVINNSTMVQTGNQFQDFMSMLTNQVNISRLPPPEPSTFLGDPLAYPSWNSSFEALVDSRGIPPNEKMHYLRKYLGGSAKKAVEGYFLVNSDTSYDQARQLLQKRFGDPFIIASAFRDKLETWPKLHPRDGLALRNLADFLRQCFTAMSITSSQLSVLNDQRENRKILDKLPDWLVNQWNRKVYKWREERGTHPPFEEFLNFIEREAEMACDPVTSLQSLRKTEKAHGQNQADLGKIETSGKKNQGVRSLATGITETKPGAKFQENKTTPNGNKTCLFCQGTHSLDFCPTFQEKPVQERKDFVFKSEVCFGCLRKGKHKVKDCKNRLKCRTCTRLHPTALHGDRIKAAENTVNSTNIEPARSMSCKGLVDRTDASKSSMILPVWISHRDQPQTEHMVYAMLDNQSDTTFILEETWSEFGIDGIKTRLKLSTMAAESQVIEATKVQGLVVRGIDSSVKIELPAAFTREIMPADRSHIPTPEMANRWTHLQEIADKFKPLQPCKVGLLIGYNCPRALAPREVVCGEGNDPFAEKTDLGWGIVGVVDQGNLENMDIIGTSHRTLTCDAPPERITIVMKTQVVTEVVTPHDIMSLMEKDFKDCSLDEASGLKISQEDNKFMAILQQGIHRREDGHYEMPLPLRTPDVMLPNNRQQAMCRLNQLKGRLGKDKKYHEHYKNFMKDAIAQGHASKIPEDNQNIPGKVWYIPHFGIYHPKKKDKIRIVFDCSAKYHNQSLNDCLLQGPDLTNSLIGVLIRFREELVAFMCDVQQMFHQFLVNEEDRDFLRFLWWEDGDYNSTPCEYRMNVHLFGATSSPGCANFGLRQIATDYEEGFGTDAKSFIHSNFYVDDGLKSMQTD
jgi:hypothetical protein